MIQTHFFDGGDKIYTQWQRIFNQLNNILTAEGSSELKAELLVHFTSRGPSFPPAR